MAINVNSVVLHIVGYVFTNVSVGVLFIIIDGVGI